MATEPEVAGGTGAERERRAHFRCLVDEDASILLVTPHRSLRCRMVELSLGGCRVRTRELNRIAPGMHLEIHFKVNGIAFHLGGFVKWACTGNEPAHNHGGRGPRLETCLEMCPEKCETCINAGIRFSTVLPRQLEDLGDVLAELEARARNKAAQDRQPPAPQATPPAQPQAEPPSAQALADASVSVPATPPEPKVGGSARERRVQTREPVDTSAVVFVVKSGSRLEGRIVDLSPGGCGIRFGERHLRGIYTRVEVEFRLEGLPFRLSGVIQSIRDQHTVGIRFVDLSERKQSQVSELIAELRALNETESDPVPSALEPHRH